MSEGDGTTSAPAPAMTVTVARAGSAAVVTVAGDLDLLTARELMTTLEDVRSWPDAAVVVVDLSAVGFLGSSGLGTLADLAGRSTAAPVSGRAVPPLRLVAPAGNQAVVRPWETMNLQQILPLYPDVAAALAAV